MIAKQNCKMLFFCRAPVLGQVKKRLAADVGEHEALRIYQQLMAHNLKLAGEVDFADVDVVTTDTRHSYFESLKKQGIKVFMQQGDGLGQRLVHAFKQAFETHQSAVLLGVDTFDMTLAHLQKSVNALQYSDAVITPVEDGGYILIGLSQHQPEVFRDIDWGTDQVFEQTCQRFAQLNLSYEILPKLRDIDVLADLKHRPGNDSDDKLKSCPHTGMPGHRSGCR